MAGSGTAVGGTELRNAQPSGSLLSRARHRQWGLGSPMAAPGIASSARHTCRSPWWRPWHSSASRHTGASQTWCTQCWLGFPAVFGPQRPPKDCDRWHTRYKLGCRVQGWAGGNLSPHQHPPELCRHLSIRCGCPHIAWLSGDQSAAPVGLGAAAVFPPWKGLGL